jgi:hypothetical protein
MATKTDKVTSEDLRAIRMGESRVFELPTYPAVRSAQATAYYCGRVEGCRFVFVTERDSNTITITRMPR